MNLLSIQKLVLLGPSYKRTLHFERGLNVIRGDRTSGKSLVLSLIDYCFGKSEGIVLKVQKQLDKYCDEVFLEVCINGEVLTLNRSLKQKVSKISIYFCTFEEISGYIPKTTNIKEAIQIIMRKLNINEYQRTKFKAHSNEQELETISFRDIFRFVYIKQHSLGTDDFLDNKSTFKKNKNPYAFEMIFNLIQSDKDQLNEQLVNARNNIEARKREITGLKSYLEDKEAESLVVLIGKSTKIKEKINNQKQQKENILRNESNITNDSESETYIKLKNSLTEIANRISEHEKEKRDIYLSIESKRFLLDEYTKEMLETDLTVEVNYRLIVTEHSMKCPLCASNVSSHIHQENTLSQEVLNKIQKEIKSKINMVNNLIENDIKKIDEIEAQVNNLNEEKEILNDAINVFAKKTSVPFLSQVDSINSLINSYNKKKEITDECIKIHRKINEKNELIEDLEKEVSRLEGDLKKLKVSEEKKEEIFTYLNKMYKSFMSRLKYDTTETFISYDDYTPFHDGASVFEHESGGLLECMQISYLAAIVSSKELNYAVGHPGFLLMDSISKYLGTIRSDMDDEDKERKGRINDPEVYEEIYKIFIELSEHFQLIIVDNTPPVEFADYSRYTFLSGDEGLINLQLNEFIVVED